MKTCSVTSFSDLNMFNGFEWGSYEGVLLFIGMCFFQLLFAQYSIVFFVFILKLLSYFHFPPHFSSLLPP